MPFDEKVKATIDHSINEVLFINDIIAKRGYDDTPAAILTSVVCQNISMQALVLQIKELKKEDVGVR